MRWKKMRQWKRIVVSFLLILSLTCGIASAGAENLTDILTDSRTAQSFSDEAVSDEDLNLILQAGLAATSAINQQPWYFVAVTNQDVIAEIKGSAGGAGGFGGAPGGAFPGGSAPEGGFPGGGKPEGAPEGFKPEGGFAPPAGGSFGVGAAKASLGDSPVAIIIYMNEKTSSPNASFDCGLACENMFIAAKALGYGAKIVSSPTMQLNGANHDALCEKLGVDTAYTAVAVLLIGREATDAVTSASVRNDMADKVSIIK